MRFCLLSLTVLVAGCGSTEPPVLTSEDQMRADLKQYHDGVLAAWAYTDSKQSNQAVNLTAVKDVLLARIDASTTPSQFAQLLQEFAAALQDGHSLAMTAELGEPFPNSWPIGVHWVKEGVIVTNLNWLAENPGIQLGDRVIQVDGQTIESYVQARMAITSASTDLARQVLAVDALHFTAANQVKLTLERSEGSTYEVDLPCLPHRVDYRQQQRTEFCTHRVTDDGIGVIRIPMFTWNESKFLQAEHDHERDIALNDAKDRIDAAFAGVHDCPALILDLRNNSGGFELLSSYVAEHLVPEDFLYYSSERQNSQLVRSLDAYKQLGDEYFGAPIPQYPRRWEGFRHFDGSRFTGPVVVLINSRCFSTTDNLCAFLQDARPQTRFVGQATHGGTGEPVTVLTLQHSGVPIQFCISRIYSPLGRLIEGTGTLPDIPVQATRDDVLTGYDRAMNLANTLCTHESFDSLSAGELKGLGDTTD